MSLFDRVDELEQLNDSKSRQLARAESTIDTLKASNDTLRRSFDREVGNMKHENIAMKQKVDRMKELSAENLLLAADAADLQGELTELREEARTLRNRCFELTEDNRSLKVEVRDLRRHIDCLKGRPVDPRQELLEKIEYYQAEHDRLLDEVRVLKRRLGEITPKSPRSRSPAISPRRGRDKSPYREASPRRSSPNRSQTTKGVRFSDEQLDRTSAGDAIAAVTATMQAADRVLKDRSMPPAVALNLRDLTMDRYQKHLEGDSPRSVDSDNTELLLKPTIIEPRDKAPSCARHLDLSDDESEEFNQSNKPRYPNGTGRSRSPGRSRDRRSEGGRASPTTRSRSKSPGIGGQGYRSLSPRNRPVPQPRSSNERTNKPTTEYPPEMHRALPRRAFATRNPSDLRLGYSIKFTRPGGKISRGTVKYVGHLPGRSEVFVGVESDDIDGKHCGTFQGVKYFSCSPNRGIFTPFSKIIMAYE